MRSDWVEISPVRILADVEASIVLYFTTLAAGAVFQARRLEMLSSEA